MAKQQTIKQNKGIPQVFDMSSRQCLWSQIGAAGPRLCHNAFDCLSCSFDRMMQRKKKPPESRWTRDRWLKTPAKERYCRHMLSGRVPYKLCIHAYHCSDCSFNHMIDEEILYCPSNDIDLAAAGGFMFAEQLLFSQRPLMGAGGIWGPGAGRHR